MPQAEKPTEQFTFGEALHRVVSFPGCAYRRNDWKRADYIFLCNVDPFGSVVTVRMKSGVLGPYHPTNCDMTASDWVPSP